MNNLFKFSMFLFFLAFAFTSCELATPRGNDDNNSVFKEQEHIEQNHAKLMAKQPSPTVDWSLERDNLKKRFELMNDRDVMFYMYIFNYNSSDPIGYYQVNKVSSVNSQLTNPDQIVISGKYDTPGEYSGRTAHVVDSPAEDGSFGTNGDAIFGFTPGGDYIEHNMQYIVCTTPLNFGSVRKLKTFVDTPSGASKKIIEQSKKGTRIKVQ